MTDKEILLNEIKEGIFTYRWDFPEHVVVSNDFEKWFFDSAEFLGTLCNVPKELVIKQDTPTQCFHNSQLLVIYNEGAKYFEGFIYGPKFKECYHHGFNQIDNCIVDVTYLASKYLKKLRDQYFVYYGIYIPNDFIEKYKEKISLSDQHNPILLDYYNFVYGR